MRILNYKQTDYVYKMNSTSVMLYTVISALVEKSFHLFYGVHLSLIVKSL
jgi:hypothetical protein